MVKNNTDEYWKDKKNMKITEMTDCNEKMNKYDLKESQIVSQTDILFQQLKNKDEKSTQEKTQDSAANKNTLNKREYFEIKKLSDYEK